MKIRIYLQGLGRGQMDRQTKYAFTFSVCWNVFKGELTDIFRRLHSVNLRKLTTWFSCFVSQNTEISLISMSKFTYVETVFRLCLSYSLQITETSESKTQNFWHSPVNRRKILQIETNFFKSQGYPGNKLPVVLFSFLTAQYTFRCLNKN